MSDWTRNYTGERLHKKPSHAHTNESEDDDYREKEEMSINQSEYGLPKFEEIDSCVVIPQIKYLEQQEIDSVHSKFKETYLDKFEKVDLTTHEHDPEKHDQEIQHLEKKLDERVSKLIKGCHLYKYP